MPGDDVALLHPEDAVFEAMLEGWASQQRGGRQLQANTIDHRLQTVRRFSAFAHGYPWQSRFPASGIRTF